MLGEQVVGVSDEDLVCPGAALSAEYATSESTGNGIGKRARECLAEEMDIMVCTQQ